MDAETQINIRLPESVKKQLEEVADREHRSLSAQVRVFIEQALNSLKSIAPSGSTGQAHNATSNAA